MEAVSLIVLVFVGIIVFMIAVYITRWIFGIDQIIELQKEQTKLIRKLVNKEEEDEKRI